MYTEVSSFQGVGIEEFIAYIHEYLQFWNLILYHYGEQN